MSFLLVPIISSNSNEKWVFLEEKIFHIFSYILN